MIMLGGGSPSQSRNSGEGPKRQAPTQSRGAGQGGKREDGRLQPPPPEDDIPF
jgi:hypothetical protein